MGGYREPRSRQLFGNGEHRKGRFVAFAPFSQSSFNLRRLDQLHAASRSAQPLRSCNRCRSAALSQFRHDMAWDVAECASERFRSGAEDDATDVTTALSLFGGY